MVATGRFWSLLWLAGAPYTAREHWVKSTWQHYTLIEENKETIRTEFRSLANSSPFSHQKQEKQKNPSRLVTMHNNAGFYAAGCDNWPTMKNGLLSKIPHSELQSHNYRTCNAVQLQWENPFQIPLKLGIQYKTWTTGVFLTKYSWYANPHLLSTTQSSKNSTSLIATLRYPKARN